MPQRWLMSCFDFRPGIDELLGTEQRLQFFDAGGNFGRGAMGCEPLPDLLNRKASLSQHADGLGVQRFSELPHLVSGFTEVLAILGEDANAVVGSGRLNAHQRLLVLGQHGQDREPVGLGGGLQRVELFQFLGGDLLERRGDGSFFDIDFLAGQVFELLHGLA